MPVSTGESAVPVDAAHVSVNGDEITTLWVATEYTEDGTAHQHLAKDGQPATIIAVCALKRHDRQAKHRHCQTPRCLC